MSSNVTDLSPQESAKALSSAMISFNINAKDSMKILDSWNEIQNNFRTSAKDLSDSINEVGSSARTIGQMDINKLNAFTTAINSATGASGTETGTAIKSMISRIYRVGAEGAEDAGKAEKALKSIGVAVRDANNDFRGFDTIVSETTSKFQTLSKSQQMFISQAVGGTHHYNKFIALMNNANIVSKSLEASVNSQNSAYEENQKYIGSVSGQLQIFKTNLEAIKQSVVKSNDLKTMLSFVNGIANFLSKIGGVKVALISLNTILLLSNKVFRDWTKEIKNPKDAITLLGMVIQSFTSKLRTNVAETGVMKGAYESLKGSVRELGITAKLTQMALTMGLSLVITAITEQIVKITNRLSELKQANEQVLSSYKENVKSNSDMINYLKTEGKEYDTLSKKANLNANEQKKLSDIREKLAEKFPSLIVGYDNEGKAIIDNTKNTKELIEALKEKNKLENAKLLTNGGDALEEVQKSMKKSNKEINKFKEELAEIDGGGKSGNTRNIDNLTTKLGVLRREQQSGKDVTKEILDLENALKELQIERATVLKKISVEESNQKNEMQKLKPYMSAIIEEYGDLTDTQKKFIENNIKLKPEDIVKLEKGNFSSLTMQINEIIDEIKKSPEIDKIGVLLNIENPKDNEIQEYINNIISLAESKQQNPMDLMKLLPLKADKNKIKQVIDDYIKQINEQFLSSSNETERSKLNSLLGSLNDLKISLKVEGGEEIGNATNSMADLKTIEEEVVKSMKDTKDEMRDVNQVLDQHAKSGEWNNQILEKLVEKHPYLIKYLGDDQKMTQALTGLKEDLNKKAFERLDMEMQVISQSLNGYGVDVNAYADAQSAKTAIAQTETQKRLNMLRQESNAIGAEIDSLTAKKNNFGLTESEQIRLENLQRGGMYVGNKVGEAMYQIESISRGVDKYYDLQGLKNKLGNFYSGVGSKDYDGKKNSQPKSHKEKQDVADLDLKIDRYQNLKTAIDEVNYALDRNKQKQESAYGNEKYRLMNEEIDLINKKRDALNSLWEEQVKEQRELESQLSNAGFNVNNGQISNLEANMQSWVGWANSLSGDNKKNAQEEVKKLQEATKRYAELVSKDIASTNKEWYELGNTIRKIHEEELNIASETQRKMVEMLKKRVEDSKKLIEQDLENKRKALQDEQDLYNKQNKEQDYEKNLNEEKQKLMELQQQINNMSRDTSQAGQMKLRALMKEAEAQQKKIDDMILQHQRDLNNEKFEEEKRKAEEEAQKKKDELDKKYDDKTLLQMANEAIINGFFKDIDGKFVDTKKAYMDFQSTMIEGLDAVGGKLQTEFLGKLEMASQILKNLGLISANIGVTITPNTLPSYAVGTSFIPHDQIAQVHQGEAIIPKKYSFFTDLKEGNIIGAYKKLSDLGVPLLQNDIIKNRLEVDNIKTPTVVTNNKMVSVNIDKMVEVQGGITEDIMPKVINMVDNAIDKFTTEFKESFA